MIFEGLSDKLQGAFSKLKSKGKLTEKDVKAAMREVKLALLEADVNFKVVKDFVKKVQERCVGQEVMESLTPAQHVIKIVNEELTALMGDVQSKITISSKPPTIIMMVFTSIYGVVDGIFVSNVVGNNAFASINLIMPAIMIIGIIGFMIGTGGSAIISKTLGEGNKDEANKQFSMLIYLEIILGGIFTIIVIALLRPIAKLLGATEEMISNCLTYGRILC